MLGPIICQTIRPLVFKAGLWTIEVEKSWAHLFDMVATLMKVCFKVVIKGGRRIIRNVLALEKRLLEFLYIVKINRKIQNKNVFD